MLWLGSGEGLGRSFGLWKTPRHKAVIPRPQCTVGFATVSAFSIAQTWDCSGGWLSSRLTRPFAAVLVLVLVWVWVGLVLTFSQAATIRLTEMVQRSVISHPESLILHLLAVGHRVPEVRTVMGPELLYCTIDHLGVNDAAVGCGRHNIPGLLPGSPQVAVPGGLNESWNCNTCKGWGLAVGLMPTTSPRTTVFRVEPPLRRSETKGQMH